MAASAQNSGGGIGQVFSRPLGWAKKGLDRHPNYMAVGALALAIILAAGSIYGFGIGGLGAMGPATFLIPGVLVGFAGSVFLAQFLKKYPRFIRAAKIISAIAIPLLVAGTCGVLLSGGVANPGFIIGLLGLSTVPFIVGLYSISTLDQCDVKLSGLRNRISRLFRRNTPRFYTIAE